MVIFILYMILWSSPVFLRHGESRWMLRFKHISGAPEMCPAAGHDAPSPSRTFHQRCNFGELHTKHHTPEQKKNNAYAMRFMKGSRRASVLNCDCCGCETSVELGRADLGACSQRTVVLQYITHMKQEERMHVILSGF